MRSLLPLFRICAVGGVLLAGGSARAALYYVGDEAGGTMPLRWTTGTELGWGAPVASSLDMAVAAIPNHYHSEVPSWRSWESAPDELREILLWMRNPPRAMDVIVHHAPEAWPLTQSEGLFERHPAEPESTEEFFAAGLEAETHVAYPNDYAFGVPEPGVALLAGVGALALAARRRVR